MSGVGWYEVIHPSHATTLIAYVHEDGSVYFPETNDGREEFAFAAARGNVHRLVRADAEPTDAEVDAACRARIENMSRPRGSLVLTDEVWEMLRTEVDTEGMRAALRASRGLT